jgi:hypothetical protein
MSVLTRLFGPNVKSLKKTRDVAGLERALATASKEDTRVEAAEALASLDAKDSVAALTAALKDPIARVRSASAEALGKIGAAQCAAALAELLHDSDSNVRLVAIGALGQIESDASANALLPLLDSPEAAVWLASRKALRRWVKVPSVASALSDFAKRLRERRRALSVEWWKTAASTERKCDVCSQCANAGSGVLLSSAEMIDSDSYVSYAARLRVATERAAGRSGYDALPGDIVDMLLELPHSLAVISDVRATPTPWLVCDVCSKRFFE